MSVVRMANQLAAMAKSVTLIDGGHVKAHTVADTPAIVNQGDCPQVVVQVSVNLGGRLTFNDHVDGGHKGRDDYEVLVYFLDSAFALDVAWSTRPRVAGFIDSFMAALSNDDTLTGAVDYATARTPGVRDDIKYNGELWRGAVIQVKAFLFT